MTALLIIAWGLLCVDCLLWEWSKRTGGSARRLHWSVQVVPLSGFLAWWLDVREGL